MRQWEFKVDIYFCNRPRALENTNDQIAIGFSLAYWLSRRRKLELFTIFLFLNVDKKFIFYHDRIVARERIQQINLLRSRFLGGTSLRGISKNGCEVDYWQIGYCLEYRIVISREL